MALAAIVGVIFGLVLFGNYLNVNYRSLIASSPKAKPLLDEDTLRRYADQLVTDLAAKNVEFAIISRAGQSRKRLPPGVQYTHSAYFVRNGADTYDVYNLYHGEENRRLSSLVQDAPSDFIRPTRAHDFGVIIPSDEFQQKMKSHILSAPYGRTHNPSYSLISNPFDVRYQNCNEFVLDEMASVHWDEPEVDALKRKLTTAFKPTVIKAGIIRRYIAPFVDERLVMKDHAKYIQTTTREDLVEFMTSQGILEDSFSLDFKP